MTTELVPATPLCLVFEDNLVRFVGTKDRLEWIGNDACRAMKITDVTQALRRLPDKYKGMRRIHTPGGVQNMVTIYEPGLYALVVRSNKPEALRFQDWLFETILPCIRQHGTYPAPQPVPTKTDPTVAIGNCPYTKRMMHIETVEQLVPDGYWCIFVEGHSALLKAQVMYNSIGVPMGDLDLMDGSVGLRYGKFRAGKPWAGERVPYKYTFPPDDARGTVFPWAYPDQELPHFRAWLKKEYWPKWFPAYIEGYVERNKHKDERYARLLPAAQAMRALSAATV